MGRWVCLYGIPSGVELQAVIVTDMIETGADPDPRPKTVAQRHAPFPQKRRARDPSARKEAATDATGTELTDV